MVLLALPPADHLLIERDRGQFVASRRRRMMANARAERLLKIPAEPSPELRIPGAAAQTRVVSMAGIRLGSWESARAFKGLICDDISRFESSHATQPVLSPSVNRYIPLKTPRHRGISPAWPLAARAQQPAMPVVGLLGSASPDRWAARLRAFRQGLSETAHDIQHT